MRLYLMLVSLLAAALFCLPSLGQAQGGDALDQKALDALDQALGKASTPEKKEQASGVAASPPRRRYVSNRINFPDQIFSNWNTGSVFNRPVGPVFFAVGRAMKITMITTYHWNNAQGSPPGQISLRSDTGKIFGPWAAEGRPGSLGVQNANWVVRPEVVVPAGRYQVLDSDMDTWSRNFDSDGLGFAAVCGAPVGEGDK